VCQYPLLRLEKGRVPFWKFCQYISQSNGITGDSSGVDRGEEPLSCTYT